MSSLHLGGPSIWYAYISSILVVLQTLVKNQDKIKTIDPSQTKGPSPMQ
jgi:hypothetical protein